MKGYGFTVEGEGLVCSKCADNPLYKGLIEEVESVGYPDGYTCAECGNLVKATSLMKVITLHRELDGWTRTLKIKVEGVVYDTELQWDRYDGYELTFFDKDRKEINWPKWAEDYDNANRDLLSDLDRMSDKSEVKL